MSERGSEFDVIDRVDWSRYSGQGADVRKRGERGQRLRAAGAAGGVMVVVAAAIAVGSFAATTASPAADPTTRPSTRPVATPDPVTGFLDATDLGTSFHVDEGTTGHFKATSLDGMKADCSAPVKEPLETASENRNYLGTVADKDAPPSQGLPAGQRGFLIYETFYPLPDGRGAQAFAEFKALFSCGAAESGSGTKVTALPDIGDGAFAVSGTTPIRTLGIRVGGIVIRVDLVGANATGYVPIPGGDAWITQVAQKAVERLKAGNVVR